jgi:hypothetical protein
MPEGNASQQSSVPVLFSKALLLQLLPELHLILLLLMGVAAAVTAEPFFKWQKQPLVTALGAAMKELLLNAVGSKTIRAGHSRGCAAEPLLPAGKSVHRSTGE